MKLSCLGNISLFLAKVHEFLNAMNYFTVHIILEVCTSEITSLQVNQAATWNSSTTIAHNTVLILDKSHTFGVTPFLLDLTFKVSEMSPHLSSALCYCLLQNELCSAVCLSDWNLNFSQTYFECFILMSFFNSHESSTPSGKTFTQGINLSCSISFFSFSCNLLKIVVPCC